jgi:hypothetical protein
LPSTFGNIEERCDAETWEELIVFSRRRRKREEKEKAGAPEPHERGFHEKGFSSPTPPCSDARFFGALT